MTHAKRYQVTLVLHSGYAATRTFSARTRDEAILKAKRSTLVHTTRTNPISQVLVSELNH